MLLDTLSTKAFTVRTLVEVRHVRADAPRQARARAQGARGLGADDGRRLHRVGDPLPRRDGDHRRARRADVRRDAPPHERARARVERRRDRRGRRRRDPLPQPPRVRRGARRLLEARRPRAVSQHRVPGAASSPRSASASSRARSSTTRSSPPLDRRRRRAAAGATSPGRTAAARRRAPTLEPLIERGDPARRRRRPPTKGRIVILTSGTTGTPKGANRKQPETLDPVAALLVEDPAARARAHADRRAALSLLGPGAPHARRSGCRRRSSCAGASTPRTRCARSTSTARRRSSSSR